jgi:hypothetical protein
MLIRDYRQVALSCFRVYSLSARACYSIGESNDIYEVVQPQIISGRIFSLKTGIIYFSSL